MNRDTPRTEELLALYRKDPLLQSANFTIWDLAEQLEVELGSVIRQRDEYHDEIAQLEIRHAATMMHCQSVVDDCNKAYMALEAIGEVLKDDLNYTHNALELVRNTINAHKYRDITPTE